MRLDIAKDNFQEDQYQSAIANLKLEENDLPPAQAAEVHDIRGASYYMLGHFQQASNEYSSAILKNPKIIQYYICRASCLRSLGQLEEAKTLLQFAATRLKEPTINFNLRLIAQQQNNNDQILQQTDKLKEFQRFNEDYDRYKGLTLNFKKDKKSRTDYIEQVQHKLWDLLQVEEPQNWDAHIQNFSIFMNRIVKSFNFLGVLYEDRLLQMIDGLQLLAKYLEKVKKQIWLNVVSEKAINLLKDVFKKIRQNLNTLTSAKIQSFLTQAKLFIDQEAQKEVRCFKNKSSYLEHTAVSHVIQACQYDMMGSSEFEFCTAKTDKVFYIWVDPNFIRKLNPQALKKIMATHFEEEACYLYDLFWMLILKCLLNSPQGYDLVEFRKIRETIRYLYSENSDHRYQLDYNQKINNLYESCAKFNQYYSQCNLPKEKIDMIYKNCDSLKKYLDQFDQNLHQFLSNPTYYEFITKFTTTPEGQYFRDSFGLQNNYKDLITENTIIILYHFRNKLKINQLLKLALLDMACQTDKNFNGKDSFFIHYEEKENPKSFLQKIWDGFWQ